MTGYSLHLSVRLNCLIWYSLKTFPVLERTKSLLSVELTASDSFLKGSNEKAWIFTEITSISNSCALKKVIKAH